MIYCSHKGKRKARWFVISGKCHLALEQVDLKGTRMTHQRRIKDENWPYIQ